MSSLSEKFLLREYRGEQISILSYKSNVNTIHLVKIIYFPVYRNNIKI